MLVFLVIILSATLTPSFTPILATALFHLHPLSQQTRRTYYYVPGPVQHYIFLGKVHPTVSVQKHGRTWKVCLALYYPKLQLLCRRAVPLLRVRTVVQGSSGSARDTSSFQHKAESEQAEMHWLLSGPGKQHFHILFPFRSARFLMWPYSWN